jgi:phosphate transport system permease protein
VLLLIVAIGIFLTAKALPAVRIAGWHFVTEKTWFPDNTPAVFGIAALLFGTVLSSAMALVVAVPVAIGAALFVVEVAPARLGRPIGYLMDLLAAVPSVVYGLWAVAVLGPFLKPVERFLDSALGFIPLFDNRTRQFTSSTLFVASIVLAIMVLPIIAALAREIFTQVPDSHREAARALGATPWETMRTAVLPFSRGGLVGASMLGLGRALGETIALALVLGGTYNINPHITEPGGNTIAANIAVKFGEAGAVGRSALVASGLVLFGLTLVVNMTGRLIVRRTTAS